MGKRPGRGVGDVLPELEVPQQRRTACSTSTLDFLHSYGKTYRQKLDDYDLDTYATAAEYWLNDHGDKFFGPNEGTRYRWPQHMDRLVPPIRDMMLRQWSYQKARVPEKDWPSSDSEEEYEDLNRRKRPRVMDEGS